MFFLFFILDELKMNDHIRKMHILEEVDSTNNYANGLILSKAAEEGTVVLAYYQNSGRGQKGNTWESEYGKNVLMSMVFFPEFLSVEDQFLISKIVSIGIVEYLRGQISDVTIKWPNDIYVRNQKITGILIENSVKRDHIVTSVVGIGLNTNQLTFNSNLPNPVSMKILTGMDYDIKEVAAKVADSISKWYRLLQNGKVGIIDETYFFYLYKANEWHFFYNKNLEFEGKITGIGQFGKLIIEDRSGKKEEYYFKEIEYIP